MYSGGGFVLAGYLWNHPLNCYELCCDLNMKIDKNSLKANIFPITECGSLVLISFVFSHKLSI